MEENELEEAYIPINKGNYSMETPEREKLFEQYRAEGWEEEYAAYRRAWTEYAKQQYVSDYPLLVDIELSTVCNLHCPMCYTITEEFKGKVKGRFMDMKLFYKIVDEITGKVPAVRLSLRGEPSLHPQFIDCIRYCKEHGIGEVSFLTNGSRLSEEYFRQIVDAGADWITVSIDGIGENYERTRKPLSFQETLEKVKMMKRVKEEAGRHKPVVKIQSIWPAIRENPEEYYNLFVPYTDLIAFNPLIDFTESAGNRAYEERFSCPQLYQRIVIGADGMAMMCSNDEDGMNPVGDAWRQSIYEIWHGGPLEEARQQHRRFAGAWNIPVCGKCFLPRKTEEHERALVNGREFFIKNYV